MCWTRWADLFCRNRNCITHLQKNMNSLHLILFDPLVHVIDLGFVTTIFNFVTKTRTCWLMSIQLQWCWWHSKLMASLLRRKIDNCDKKWPNPSPKSESSRQHILSPTWMSFLNPWFRKYTHMEANQLAGKYLARKFKPVSLVNLEIFQIRLDDMFLISSMKGLVNRGSHRLYSIFSR